MREIRFYRTGSGHCPVEDFLDDLPSKKAQKVVWVLRLIEELNDVPTQYFKKLVGTNALWEARARQGGDAYRLLGFFDGPRLVILTSGFSKKSQKVPREEIELASRRKKDYLARKARRTEGNDDE